MTRRSVSAVVIIISLFLLLLAVSGERDDAAKRFLCELKAPNCIMEDDDESCINTIDRDVCSLGNTFSCSADHSSILSLNLDNEHLTCLPSSITSFSSLSSLSMNDAAMEVLPFVVCSLGNTLQTLEMRGNRLQSLPAAVGELTRLTTLDLSLNRLNQLPLSLNNLVSLTTLDLTGNCLDCNAIRASPEFSGLIKANCVQSLQNQSCSPSSATPTVTPTSSTASRAKRATSCDPNYYLSGSTCQQCPAGQESIGGTVTGCTYCTAGTFRTAGSTLGCSPCSTGTAGTNCLTCSTTTGSCTQCALTTGNNNGVCEVCMAGTYSNDGTTACTTCSTGYFRLGGSSLPCVPCYSGVGGSRCEQCVAASGLCNKCYKGNGILNYTCTRCPAGTYSDGTQPCTTCSAGTFRLDNETACNPCSQGSGGTYCTACSPSTGFCTACTPGYMLSAGVCIICPSYNTFGNGTGPCLSCKTGPGGPNCNYCDSTTGTCLTCVSGYGLVAGKCVACNPGYFTAGTGNCLTCGEGSFRIASTGACVACSSGSGGVYCTNCDLETGTCTRCSAGYGLSPEKVCVRCSTGYFSDGTGACLPCSSGTGGPDCQLCAATTGACQQCPSGLGITSGVCVQCPDGTASTGTTACLGCASNQFRIAEQTAQCVSCTTGIGGPTCLYCNAGTGACTQCSAGSGLSNNNCTVCPLGYYSNGLTPCTACASNLFRSATYSTCVSCASYGTGGAGCIKCDGPTGICTKCTTNYGLYGTVCNACASGSWSNGTGPCVSCIYGSGGEHCITCDATLGTCTRCEPGYGLFNGACTKCDAGMYNTGTTACTSCVTGYFRLNNSGPCIPCSSGPGGPNCEKCDQATGTCSKCLTGFGLTADSFCLDCPITQYSDGSSPCHSCADGISGEHCLQCSGTMGTCTKCQPGYGLASGVCTLCSTGYQSDGTVACTACPAGYFRTATNGTSCIPCSVGPGGATCATCAPKTGVCATCASGSGFDNAKMTCTVCSPGTFSAGTQPCTACAVGTYRFSYQTACTACSAGPGGVGCAQCNQVTGRCLKCNAGYGLYNGYCQACQSNSWSVNGSSACIPCWAGPGGPACDTCVTTTGFCTSCNTMYGLDSAVGVCTKCEQGYYSTGTTDCSICAAGYYRLPGTAACVACSFGTGGTGCISCDQKTGECNKCANGWGLNGTVCNPCQAGTFSSGAFPCKPCSEGEGGPNSRYCTSPEGSSTRCQPGYGFTTEWWDYWGTYLHSPTCTECLSGTYSDGTIFCRPCAANYWRLAGTGPCRPCAESPGGTTCATCSMGTGLCSLCNSGSGFVSGTCTPCPLGLFSAGNAACSLPPAGYYTSAPGITALTACSSGPSGVGCSLCRPDDGWCTTCSPGYGFVNRICQDCPSGTWSNGTTPCLTCSSGPAGYGCAVCNQNTGACTTCRAGYGLVNGKCVACTAGMYSAGTTDCTACAVGYFRLADSGPCVPCSSGPGGLTCSVCEAQTGVCTGCAAGSGFQDNFCLVCTAGYFSGGNTPCLPCSSGPGQTGCQLCTSTTGACTQCDNNYGLQGGSCSACPSGTFSTGTVACANCATGYYRVDSASCLACSTAGPGTENCEQCLRESGACTKCKSGYGYIGTNGTCFACPAGTYSFGATGCTTCASGYFRKAGSSGDCGLCSTGPGGPSCATCDPTTGSCLSCAPGSSPGTLNGEPYCQTCPTGSYSLGTGPCLACRNASGTSCINCNPATGVCVACSPGNGLTGGGVCYHCDAGTYSTGTALCLACSDGYYRRSEMQECQPCSSGTGGSNCIQCTAADGSCTGCSAGFGLTNGVCNLCLSGTFSYGKTNCLPCSVGTAGAGCLLCSGSTSACTYCDAGYFLSGGACNVCGKGTWSVAGATSCSPCATGLGGAECLTCQSVTSNCTSCTMGYALVAGVCTALPTNSTNSWSNGTTASLTCAQGPGGPACLACSSTTGTCTKCSPGYGLVSGVCKACATGYYGLGMAACLPCNVMTSSCTECMAANGTCTKCVSSYGLINKLCVSCGAGLTSDATGKCVACPTGSFKLTGTTCVSCATGPAGAQCATCVASTGICTSCQPGYAFKSNACIPCGSGTFNLLGTGDCIPCANGTAGSTALLCVPSTGAALQCAKGSGLYNGVCQTCPAGTEGDGFGLCSGCPSGSYKPSGSTVCVSCATGTGGALCSRCDYSTGVCNSCKPGNGLDTTTGQCTKCEAGTYSDGATVCKACTSDKFTDGTTPCSSCSLGPAGTPCLKCKAATGLCTKCSNGYGIESGLCVQCSAGSFGNGTTSCMNCPTGFFTSDPTTPCTACWAGPGGETCLKCDLTSGACTKCSVGSGITDGICYTCGDMMWSDGTVPCTACTSGGSACDSCDATTGICSQCAAGYEFDSSHTCVECPINTFAPGNSSCQQCIFGTKCTACSSQTGACTACSTTGYVPSGTGCRLPIFNRTVIVTYGGVTEEQLLNAIPTLQDSIATKLSIPDEWVLVVSDDGFATVASDITITAQNRSEVDRLIALLLKLLANNTFANTILGSATGAAVKTTTNISSSEEIGGTNLLMTILIVLAIILAGILFGLLALLLIIKFGAPRKGYSKKTLKRIKDERAIEMARLPRRATAKQEIIDTVSQHVVNNQFEPSTGESAPSVVPPPAAAAQASMTANEKEIVAQADRVYEEEDDEMTGEKAAVEVVEPRQAEEQEEQISRAEEVDMQMDENAPLLAAEEVPDSAMVETMVPGGTTSVTEVTIGPDGKPITATAVDEGGKDKSKKSFVLRAAGHLVDALNNLQVSLQSPIPIEDPASKPAGHQEASEDEDSKAIEMPTVDANHEMTTPAAAVAVAADHTMATAEDTTSNNLPSMDALNTLAHSIGPDTITTTTTTATEEGKKTKRPKSGKSKRNLADLAPVNAPHRAPALADALRASAGSSHEEEAQDMDPEQKLVALANSMSEMPTAAGGNTTPKPPYTPKPSERTDVFEEAQIATTPHTSRLHRHSTLASSMDEVGSGSETPKTGRRHAAKGSDSVDDLQRKALGALKEGAAAIPVSGGESDSANEVTVSTPKTGRKPSRWAKVREEISAGGYVKPTPRHHAAGESGNHDVEDEDVDDLFGGETERRPKTHRKAVSVIVDAPEGGGAAAAPEEEGEQAGGLSFATTVKKAVSAKKKGELKDGMDDILIDQTKAQAAKIKVGKAKDILDIDLAPSPTDGLGSAGDLLSPTPQEPVLRKQVNVRKYSRPVGLTSTPEELKKTLGLADSASSSSTGKKSITRWAAK